MAPSTNKLNKDAGETGYPRSAVSEELTSRMVPHDRQTEMAVLGSMLLDPQCIAEVVEVISRDAFYQPEHQVIFDAIVSLFEHKSSNALDALLLRDELERKHQLKRIGNEEYIAAIVDSVPSAANVLYYTQILKDKMLLRQIIEVATDILDRAYDSAGDTGEKLDEAEQKLFAITNQKITGSATAIKDLVTQAFEMIERREGSHVTGLPTGFTRLDELTCGLQNGEMIIIAGRPSMGKTSLALNIAECMGVVEKIPIAIFSLEMGKQQLAERFLCSNSEIDSQLVRKGMLGTDHYQKLVQACGELSQAPIFIDDTAGLTPLELRAKARRLKRMHDIKCLMVDYLQLMHLGLSRVESRQQEITSISRYLKALARELNIPVIVLSQLNRSPEGREDHRPRMSDLRESGSIEQDADVVMLLHREDYYHRGDPDHTPTNLAEVIIAKQRNGPTDTVQLVFREKLTRFENASVVEDEPF